MINLVNTFGNFTNYSQNLQMPYITYLNFAEHIIGLICQLFTIVIISILLIIYNFNNGLLKVKHFSRSMLFYLSVHLFCSTLGIPHLIYKVCWWKPLEIQDKNSAYNPYILFWTGLPELSYMSVAPFCVLYLIIDRCLALRLPTNRTNKLIFFISIIIAFLIYCSSLLIYIEELPLDLTKVSRCELASCLMIKYRNILQLSTKMIIGTFNVIFCLLFLYLLAKSGKGKNLKNRVVKYTIMLEILFNVLPGYSAVIFNVITGIPSSIYIGEFALVFCAIDAAICSSIYLKLFLVKKNTTSFCITTQMVAHIHPITSSQQLKQNNFTQKE
ncbi:hypothetical protein Mgra_00002514 [Meloidogyne graminicola]|uniref:Uncharacterized protein n=1 Tax=Meloidogyne graminicola TaxID=189291 RepID=A0A8S9ZWM3_9BILA|nr:hypothetical protein Mgra_00002514 [Meloidogyne graminicola]